ncbi:hypothetical protein F0U44_03610 [Nocardioides humilatus]|uniref:Sortilin N-terminal domain-containing protein n=1 Tax=Nocardioides humilatus TaxID=2607660 RepID=A0A5B1LP64_9ACTN|nr:hypothetical protein [Nocardioides humilatus]KAA1421397.1 hypothetical protein F0U44_03610 [Nocardioides humilatus]
MRRLLQLVLTLALLPLVLLGATVPPAHAAVPDVWVKWNLGDHWIRSLDYVTPGQLVAGSETDGVFTAATAAGPWTDISGNLSTQGKQVHEAKGQSGQIFLATSAGLFRGSGNGTWTKLGVDEDTPQPMRLDQGGVQSVVFPTAGTTNIVVSTAGSGHDGIFYSSDSGVKWTQATGITGGAYSLTKGTGSLMYAASATGFYISLDAGKSWTLSSDGIPPGESALRIAVSPLDPSELIAATTSSVYRSSNGGLTWYDATGSGPGALLATQVRAFQLIPSAYWGGGEPRIVVGTNSGVWATVDGGEHWTKMSATKLNAPGEIGMDNESVWALNIGFGTPGSLIAGTQGHGIFALPLSAVDAPGVIAAPSGSAVQGYTLTANDGVWGGTGPFFYRYQWKRCTSTSTASCVNIAGETGRTYVVTSGDVGKYLRVGVRAINVVTPVFSTEVLSNPVGPIAAPAGPEPTPPPNYPKLLDAASAPWGATFTIDPSDLPSNQWRSNGTPMATTFEYRWYRCEQNLSACLLLPQSGIAYTSTVDDVGKVIQATVVGQIGGTKSPERLAGTSGSVYERKPVNTAKPKVVGPAYVGTKLQSTAGAWTGTNPTFTRRWFRCAADGTQCNLTSPVVTAPTYTVTSADRGFTFRVEVTATVTDQFQNRTEVATSDKSAKAVNPPPTCAELQAAIAAAKADVRAKKRALANAQETGNAKKIRIAKRRLRAAKARLAEAQAALANANYC